MTSRKPSWMKTNAPWDIRVVIWQHWAQGDTIQKTIHFFELHKDEYEKAPMDRNTISAIKDELIVLPIELMLKLVKDVPEVKQLILEHRPDLQGKLEVSDIIDNQTFITAVAKLRHSEELIGVSERLQNELSIPRLLWYWLPTMFNYDKYDTSLNEWLERYATLLTVWDMSEPIVSDTDPLIFRSLISHLQAESPEFKLEMLVEWRESTRKVIVECIKFVASTFKQGVLELCLDADETEIIIDDLKGITPLSLLIPQVWRDYLKRCEATGEPEPKLSWLDFWSTQAVKHLSQSESGRELMAAINHINKRIQPQLDFINLVIRRRTFVGTCSICES